MRNRVKSNQFLRLFFVLCFVFTGVLDANALPDEIELRDTGISMSFVSSKGASKGNLKAKYVDMFLKETGVNRKIKKWSRFKAELNTSQKKGIAGEVAAKLFFKSKGYKILEEHYAERLRQLKGAVANDNMKKEAACTTKKGPDNGIDGIFVLNGDNSEKPSHIILNESKFRDKLSLSSNDFGFVAGGIQQSHSKWNRSRLGWATCLPDVNYDELPVLRFATLLDRDGTLKLYEIRDKGSKRTINGEFASEAPKQWNIRKAYDKHLQKGR